MNSYPEDLLVGVFPLVFCVNAMILQSDKKASTPTATAITSPKRSTFDRFLDVMAASLMEEDTSSPAPFKRNVSLFQDTGDGGDESSDEDELLAGGDATNKRKQVSLSAGLYPVYAKKIPLQRSTSMGSQSAQPAAASYAKALQHGQGFFQRARMQAASPRHAFPPSKDPEGKENISEYLQTGLESKNIAGLQTVLERSHSLDGILPVGWLEKHVHALPSVILVLCDVCGAQAAQDQQDKFLYETIEHLHYSLVPKRRCRIVVVGVLMLDNVTMAQAEEWSRAIVRHASEREGEAPIKEAPFVVTLLRGDADLEASDVGVAMPPALKGLHGTVREASLAYYLGQARRNKEKLARLSKGRGWSIPEPLLPLATRYCFKIAMFYEFQWKFEKSLKFMAEAYKYVTTYYRYLLRRAASDTGSGSSSPQRPSHAVADTDDSVEVALSDANPSDRTILVKAMKEPPEDMIHQCRAVSDWLNFKLLQAGFVSHTENGLMAASNQWRQHTRVYGTRRHLADSKVVPAWYDWSYISKQRLVVCELVERHPPTAFGDLGNEHDDILLRCSPWRVAEATVEALLALARELDNADLVGNELGDENERSVASNVMRAPFVGGLGSEGLAPFLREARRVDHRANAFDLILRSIKVFEHEMEREKRGFYAEDSFSERTSSRTGARLYYLAGGILLGMQRHLEALGHLEHALKLSQGWRQLELAVRRMLTDCYEKHMPMEAESSENSQRLASMILDSYFNAEMSSNALRRALQHFASVCGGESLKWYHSTTIEDDHDLPFAFHVNFPENIFATVGGTVKSTILIKSNLDYAVHVNSVTLTSLAGELPIPINDLMSATNVIEGVEGMGVIIQRNSEIMVQTEFELPKDINLIGIDDAGNGGETQATAGKGSFAKSARPRTTGITSAGGARLVSEDELVRAGAVSQGWSTRFLGGRPLRCDGLKLIFYPVQAERVAGSTDNITLIELLIEKKKPKTAANIKRTAFEEENYIASAWSRPDRLPLSYGPRSIRVLGPQPELTVTDMTAPYTDNQALEGAVNRTLLRLQAGPAEICSNLKFRVSCFSVLISPDGITKRIVSDEDLEKDPSCGVSLTSLHVRTPVLVVSDPSAVSGAETAYGYSAPSQWSLADNGQGYSGTQLPSIKKGESTFMHVNFYRPSAATFDGNAGIENYSNWICKTDYYVTISYRQERPKSVPKRKIARRLSRRRPVLSLSATADEDDDEHVSSKRSSLEPGIDFDRKVFEEVSLEYSGSLVWTRPLSAAFLPGQMKAAAAGRRNPSNTAHQQNPTPSIGEFTAADGDTLSGRCLLTNDNVVPGLKARIIAVGFNGETAGSSVSAELLPVQGRGTDYSFLYRTPESDVCQTIDADSGLSLAFAMRVRLADDISHIDAVQAVSLGNILVEWAPVTMRLPDEAACDAPMFGNVAGHGPLFMGQTSIISFPGPLCYIESAPFAVSLLDYPNSASIGETFDLQYCIENKTDMHQDLSLNVEMNGTSLLVACGTIIGNVRVGPRERELVTLSLYATHAGIFQLPKVNVSSIKYNSWVVKTDEYQVSCSVFVYP